MQILWRKTDPAGYPREPAPLSVPQLWRDVEQEIQVQEEKSGDLVMNTFKAYEFINTIKGPELTGKVEIYQAPDLDASAQYCLYTHQLKTSRARLGTTGHTVHAGLYSYSITKEISNGSAQN